MCRVISVTTPASSSSGCVGDLVGVGDQRDPLEEVGEPGRDGAGVDVGRVGRRAGHRVVGELAGDRDELGEVLHPGLVLRVVGGLELVEVAGAREHRLEDHVGPLPRVDHRLELLDHRRRSPGSLVSDRVARPGASSARRSASQKVIRSRCGERVDARLGAVADAALGGVEDPAQRDLVGRVDQHPQVGQRVADLAPLVEAHPADDLVGHADADEHLLEHPGLGVGAVEHRDVAGPRRARRR